MSYATKYRPRSLSQIKGNTGIVNSLRGALKNNRLDGTLMFAGPSGCGKTTFGRVIFNHLRCEKGSACGKCASCLNKDQSDLVEVNVAKDNGVDYMRELIETARYRPQFARKRVVILDEFHRATIQAQEALLKSLEEPPKDTLFIICTTEPGKIKDTLRKRCQIHNVVTPSLEDSTAYLQSIIEAEEVEFPYEDAFSSIYEQGGSSLRECANLLEATVNFIQGGKTAPSNDDVMKFLSASGVSSGVGTSSVDFMKALYAGDYPAIHIILLNCEDFAALVNAIIWLNSFIVDVYCTKGAKNKNIWWTPANKEIFAWFKALNPKPSLEQTIIVQTGLIEMKAQFGYAGISDRHIIGAKMYRILTEAKLM